MSAARGPPGESGIHTNTTIGASPAASSAGRIDSSLLPPFVLTTTPTFGEDLTSSLPQVERYVVISEESSGRRCAVRETRSSCDRRMDSRATARPSSRR